MKRGRGELRENERGEEERLEVGENRRGGRRPGERDAMNGEREKEQGDQEGCRRYRVIWESW